MRSQVQAQDHSKRQLDSQHQELKNDMSMVQDQRGRLERVILDAQKLLEEKDLELRAIQEDLTNAHGANDKLQEKVGIRGWPDSVSSFLYRKYRCGDKTVIR